MPTGRHLSKRTKVVASVGAIIAITIGVLVSLGAFRAPQPVTAGYEYPPPTDINKIGYLTFDSPGNQQDIPYLVYEEPGKPALKARLLIDEHTFCVVERRGSPCMAMSVLYSTVFSGKRAMVEGNMQGEDILARKIRVYGEGEMQLSMDPGHVFIRWQEAVRLTRACAVTMVTQTHGGDVYLKLKDGKELVSITPVPDEIFKLVQEVQPTCGQIAVAME